MSKRLRRPAEHPRHPGGAARASIPVRILVFYLAFVAVGMATASLGPGIPSFARNTAETLARIGALFVFHRIGYISGSLGLGRLFDRVSGTFLTGITLLLIGTGLIVLPISYSVWLLWATIFLVGLAQGTTEVGANIGVVRLCGSQAGPAMNGLHLSYGVGAIVAPLVLMQSLSWFESIRFGFWMLAGLVFLAAVCMFLVPDQHPRRERRGARLGGSSITLVALLAMLLLCTVGAEASVGGWIYSYSVAAGIGSAQQAGLLTSGFWAALTVGRLAGVYLVRRLGARTLILANTGGALAAVTLFLLVANRPLGVWSAVLLLGFSQASIVPATFTYAGQLQLLSGTVAGVFVSGASAGAMILPWVIGRLFEPVGEISFVWLVWGAQLVALLSFCTVLAATRDGASGARS